MSGRSLAVVALLGAGCHGAPAGGAPDAAPDGAAALTPDAPPDASPDRWLGIYHEVDGAHLRQLVAEMSGATPVMIDGAPVTISERYSDAGRANFRAYWTQYMTGLGLTVTPLHYQATGDPRAGDDLEAVLPGPSADSFVVIVHYDSIGPPGMETMNPGADDDMTGMAIELETARILVAHRAELGYTVRFVASDEEELGHLAGARAYAASIHAAAQAGGWKIVAAVDDEQTGWNCRATNSCGDHLALGFDIFSCGASHTQQFDYAALGDQFAAVVAAYSPLQVTRACMGQNSDHFAMWEIGVPTLVFSEHDPFDNPQFDQEGGDTYDKLDLAYLEAIARPAITFQATLAGLPQR